ncbi:MAG: hypothetical protein AB1656_23665 [Candidatus Omnitrophota bacterium]
MMNDEEFMEHNLDYKRPPKYSVYKKRAEKQFKGEEHLTEDEFISISQQNCHYCDKSGPNGIDRFDNIKGYTKENCVPCCKHCNYVKGNLSIEDFETWRDRFVKKQLTYLSKIISS